MSVEAKAKVKARHDEAITSYKKWWYENPQAKLKERVRMFDLLVDTAKLRETVPR